MAEMDQFELEVSDNPRSKMARRSLAGLEDSEAANGVARFVCFAPLALTSGNTPGQSHRVLTDSVLCGWWALMQLGTALAFIAQDGRDVVIYVHLGLLLAVALERARYLLLARKENNWTTITVKQVGAMSMSTVDRPCDSENLFEGVRLCSLRNLVALAKLCLVPMQLFALALGPNPRVVGHLHVDSGGLLWTRPVTAIQHLMRQLLLFEESEVGGEKVGFEQRFLCAAAAAALFTLAYSATSGREDSGRSLCSKISQSLFVYVHELVSGVLLIPICLTFFEAMQCSPGASLDWWGCWKEEGYWWRLFGIVCLGHFTALAVFAQIHNDLLPLFYRQTGFSGRADILFPARYEVCERLLRVIYAGLTVFLAKYERSYYSAGLVIFAALKLLNFVMAPCCIKQVNSINKVVAELLICLQAVALLAAQLDWRVDWRPMAIGVLGAAAVAMGLPGFIIRHTCSLKRMRVLICGEDAENEYTDVDFHASMSGSLSGSMSFADDDDSVRGAGGRSKFSTLMGWVSRLAVAAMVLQWGLNVCGVWSFVFQKPTLSWQCLNDSSPDTMVGQPNCFNDSYRCANLDYSYRCCPLSGYQAARKDTDGCEPCTPIRDCQAGQLSCTTAADSRCAKCELGYNASAGCEPVSCGGTIPALPVGGAAFCSQAAGGTALGSACPANCLPGYSHSRVIYECGANSTYPNGVSTHAIPTAT